MELREPKRKRRVRITLQQPFPILNRDVTTNKDLWQVYTGRYSGDFVIIDSKDEMTALYNMGFFGKGSLSRWNPEFGKMKQGIPPFVRQRQFELRKKWAAQQDELISQFKAAASKLSSESLHKGSESERNEERNGTSEKNNELNIDVNSNKDDEIIVDVTNETNEEINVVTNSEAEEDMNVDVTSIDESSSKRSETKVDEVITVDLAEEDNVSKICNKSVGKNNNNESKNNGEIVGTKRKRDEMEAVNFMEPGSSVEKCNSNDEEMLLVLPDSDDDDDNDEKYLTNLCPKLVKNPFSVQESLHLSLEEAFFLSYGLGCLQVVDMFGQFLSLNGMWQLYCKSQKDFIQKYVVYHYFRSKCWVVKTGIRNGGDFLLYKQGPPFYHASYIVIIDVVDSDTWKRLPTPQQTLTWTRLLGLNRVAESVAKEVLLCQVIWPSSASPKELEYPSILSKFKVHELLIRRWISSQEREEHEDH